MNATDGILFYFRNDREGQGACAAEVCPSVLPLANCSLPCLSGSCAEASLRNLPAEVNDFAVALPPSHPLYVGLYFTPYHSCDPPSVRYDEQAIAAALALPYVDGAVVYTLEFPRVSECAANSVDKGCVVRDIFGRWNRTSATRSLSPRCPSDFPFLAPLAAASSASESPPRMCCGTPADFPACAEEASCCLPSNANGPEGCGPHIALCTCPADRSFEYGDALSGRFCCGSNASLPSHCSGGGECCLRSGIRDGCQGRPLCTAKPGISLDTSGHAATVRVSSLPSTAAFSAGARSNVRAAESNVARLVTVVSAKAR